MEAKTLNIGGVPIAIKDETARKNLQEEIDRAKAAEAALDLQSNGVFIMTRRWFSWATSGYPQMYRPAQYNKNDNEVAVGVAVIEAGRCVVVALNDVQEGAMNWSTENLSGGTDFVTARNGDNGAFMDFNGKTKTIKQVETLGEKSLASKKCQEYAVSIKSANNGNTEKVETGILAGKWWLPSLGELQIIANHIEDVNKALVLAGGTEMKNAGYWSSTEYSAAGAWSKGLNDGNVSISTKATSTGYVRAVTAFD